MSFAIGVVGNSHIAAYKLGWERLKDGHPGIDLTFFGATGRKMGALRVQDGALVPGTEQLKASLKWTSGGQDRIRGGFDAYLVVGMGFSFPLAMRILRTHRPPSLFCPYADRQLISEECLRQATRGLLMQSIAVRTLRKLRTITDAPIVYVPNPYPTKLVLASPEAGYWGCVPVRQQVFRWYRETLEELGTTCRVMEQPESTIEDGMFTRELFSVGSVRLTQDLDERHPDDDYGHMNGEFGACVLERIFDDNLALFR